MHDWMHQGERLFGSTVTKIPVEESCFSDWWKIDKLFEIATLCHCGALKFNRILD